MRSVRGCPSKPSLLVVENTAALRILRGAGLS